MWVATYKFFTIKRDIVVVSCVVPAMCQCITRANIGKKCVKFKYEKKKVQSQQTTSCMRTVMNVHYCYLAFTITSRPNININFKSFKERSTCVKYVLVLVQYS